MFRYYLLPQISYVHGNTLTPRGTETAAEDIRNLSHQDNSNMKVTFSLANDTFTIYCPTWMLEMRIVSLKKMKKLLIDSIKSFGI